MKLKKVIVEPHNTTTSTLSGGTRSSIPTNRPWQPRLVFNPTSECPFCTGKDLKNMRQLLSGHRVFENRLTPFKYHRMLVPASCGDEMRLRSLGGAQEIETTLRLIWLQVQETLLPHHYSPLWMGTHVGIGAGQNYAHEHWHTLRPILGRPDTTFFLPESRIIMSSGQFTATISGFKMGQVIIKSNYQPPWQKVINEGRALEELVILISSIITLYNQKFNFPDYSLLIAINRSDAWRIHFTPILNNPGFTEIGATEYCTPYVMPCSHDDMVEFLKA
jgi:hypothetical protein